MNIKLKFVLKFIGFLFGLTVYNFFYENYINKIILNGFNGIQNHFNTLNMRLPDSN